MVPSAVPINLKWSEQRIVALPGILELDALVADANGALLLTPAVLAAARQRHAPLFPLQVADIGFTAIPAATGLVVGVTETLFV